MEEGLNEGDSAESMFDEIGSDALTIVAESARPTLASEGLDAVPAALHDLCRRLRASDGGGREIGNTVPDRNETTPGAVSRSGSHSSVIL
jgi:hypothetical protein